MFYLRCSVLMSSTFDSWNRCSVMSLRLSDNKRPPGESAVPPDVELELVPRSSDLVGGVYLT